MTVAAIVVAVAVAVALVSAFALVDEPVIASGPGAKEVPMAPRAVLLAARGNHLLVLTL